MNKRISLFLCLILSISSLFGIVTAYAAPKPVNSFIVSVSGEAYLQIGGGSQKIRAYANMPIYQGDTLLTGEQGNITFKVVKPESTRTIGPESRVTITALAQTKSGNKFGIKLWTGSIWNSVKTLNAADEDSIETSSAKIGVRGTNFLVIVLPDGTLYVSVASGLVTISVSGQPALLLAPTEQLSMNPNALPGSLADSVSVINVSELVGQLDPAIVKAILNSSPAITEENKQFIQLLTSQLSVGTKLNIQRDDAQSDLFIETSDDLRRFTNNINGLLSNIASNVLRLNPTDSDELKQLIEEVNAKIPGTEQDIVVLDVLPLDLTAGIDPLDYSKKRMEQARLDSLKQQIQQEHAEAEQELKRRLGILLDQIVQNQNRITDTNAQVLTDRQKEADASYSSLLDPMELALFQANKLQLNGANSNTGLPPSSTTSEEPEAIPTVTLSKSDTSSGFNLSINLNHFIGSKAFYAAEFHFISDNVIQSDNSSGRWLNNQYFSLSNSVDVFKSVSGTIGIDPATKTETIYAETNFGTNALTSIDSGSLATIPFNVTASGTIKLSYVKIVDRSGATLLEINDSSSNMPPAINYSR
jgi:hypothetical protein